MKHPWHKSLTFRLGLVPLLFLLWAWADSMHHESGLQREMRMKGGVIDAEPNHSIYHHDSRISLFLAEPVSPRDYTVTLGPIESSRRPLRGREWFPTPIRRSETVQDTVIFHERSIPHWLLILVYLILWSIAFAWRHLRIQRFSTSPAQPQSNLDLGT